MVFIDIVQVAQEEIWMMEREDQQHGAQQHGELMEEKSQHKRLTGHIQGERGEPGWGGIPEAGRGSKSKGQVTMVTAVREWGDVHCI